MPRAMVCTAICLALEAMSVLAQAPRTIPRPPADAPGFPRPEDGSAAPDGVCRETEACGRVARGESRIPFGGT